MMRHQCANSWCGPMVFGSLWSRVCVDCDLFQSLRTSNLLLLNWSDWMSYCDMLLAQFTRYCYWNFSLYFVWSKRRHLFLYPLWWGRGGRVGASFFSPEDNKGVTCHTYCDMTHCTHSFPNLGNKVKLAAKNCMMCIREAFFFLPGFPLIAQCLWVCCATVTF